MGQYVSKGTPLNIAKKLSVALAAVPLLAACGTTPPAQAPNAEGHLAAPASVTPAPASSSATTAAPTASPSSPGNAAPTPSATPSFGVRPWQPPANPAPLPVLTAEQQATFAPCIAKFAAADTGTDASKPASPSTPTPTVTQASKKTSTKKSAKKTTGTCAKVVQTELKALSFYHGTPRSRNGTAAINALLRYQYSRDLQPTGSANQATVYALASNQLARSAALPEECKADRVVLCVDQGAQQLRYVKDGKVVKTIKVRTGGYNSHPKTHKWRLFRTANGLYKVYKKRVSPTSDNYGDGSMPLSVIFDPNMYVHYSSDFANAGYAGSSHGCVNVGSYKSARWIYKNTPIGSQVYIY